MRDNKDGTSSGTINDEATRKSENELLAKEYISSKYTIIFTKHQIISHYPEEIYYIMTMLRQ